MKVSLHAILFFILVANSGFCQLEYGWKIDVNDSLKIEKNYQGGIARYTEHYKNGQLKFEMQFLNSQIFDTVVYLDKFGDTLSIVDHANLSFEIRDSAHLANALYIDSCIILAKHQVDNCFSENFIQDFIFLDYTNSRQKSKVSKDYKVYYSYLFETVNHKICSAVIKFGLKSQMGSFPKQNLLSMHFDSSYNIINSNFDTNRKYSFKLDESYANELINRYNFIEGIDSIQQRGVRVDGPFLKVIDKNLYWVIQRRAGKLHDKNQLESIYSNAYVEEILLDTEIGIHTKTMKYEGPAH